MKLWHCKSSRSLRVLWAIEEMGLECDIEVLKFPPRIFQPDYLTINPLGTVPYLVDGETALTESSGICHYLAEKYQKDEFLVRPNHPNYGAFINWLYHSDATLTFPLTIVMRYRVLEPGKYPQIADDYAKWHVARLRLLDKHLQDKTFLCGDQFTVADIAVGYALYLGDHLKISEHYSENIMAYLQRLKSRPAFKRADTVG